MTAVDRDGREHGAVFWVAVAVGWAVMAFGVVGVLDSVWLGDRPFELAAWVLGGLVVHDVLLAPLVTALGWLLAARLPAWLRGPVRAALVLTGVTLLFSYPLLRGFGRRDVNPTILPLDYGRNVVVILAAVWVGALAVALWRRSRR